MNGAPATISPPPRGVGTRALVRAMRPRQWVKNGLVLAVPAAAGTLFEREVLTNTSLALLAFCLASAGTYLVNDVADRDADRLHPAKRTRPIAAGEVSARTATTVAIGAFVLACGVALLAGVALLLVVVAYIGLTTAYSYGLKRVPIFDIAAVAAGFFLRAVAGGAASDIFISKWFLILAGGGSLFLVTAKRYAELRTAPRDVAGQRPVLSEYSEEYLRAMLAAIAGVVVVAYCIWAFDHSWATSASAVPFVMGIMRYGLLVDQGHGEEPELVLFGDRTLLGLAAACIGLLALGTAP